MAFNQPSQDSPVMMAHKQVTIDSVLYNDRVLKGQGKKQKGRNHDKEESEGSPARELKAMNRVGKYQQIGTVVGGTVCCIAGAVAAGAAATHVSQHALNYVGRKGAGPSIAARTIVSSAIAGGSAGLRHGARIGGNLGQKLDNKLARSNSAPARGGGGGGGRPRRVSP
ncbi:unnamed protein product [Aphanomyces euteiches]|uniref:Uncharacterized protein n=1 Tax=Aphanomyces euteiches TaxID=100861 RepID=A0A6G0WCE1_9STRA|nr:hypothetical protein Ae201684_017231 [Aphanomyces euteiches]KAF0723995.1 hypothetical protein Ae201684_017233 [Aphanomyces euteiches]KAH9101142.1 hypothetical protein Ae201684P_007327 [Aphanomyces euteiches]KAH9101196.1 hypothetical protein Ae201684P_007380 [Aphanomyces euteiches]KAH9148384.1 hypothetical protein AeRB84_008252 [Aphanomyces euteiches]